MVEIENKGGRMRSGLERGRRPKKVGKPRRVVKSRRALLEAVRRSQLAVLEHASLSAPGSRGPLGKKQLRKREDGDRRRKHQNSEKRHVSPKQS